MQKEEASMLLIMFHIQSGYFKSSAIKVDGLSLIQQNFEKWAKHMDIRCKLGS